MTSNHHAGSADGGRTWVLVLAATGWVVLTAVAVLLVTGIWSLDQGASSRPNQTQSPGTDRRTSVPPPRTQLPVPATPTPRAAPDLVYARSALALIPRQPTAADR